MRPLDPADLRKLLVRVPLDALVRCLRASVKLQNAIDHAVIVDRPPRTGKRLAVAKVIAPANRPPVRDLKRLNDMRPAPVFVVFRIVPEVLKELPFVDVPPAIQPCLAQLRRQCFELLDILRLDLHQDFVVLHQRLNEAVVFRLLFVLKSAVNEQALEIRMCRAARVQRVVRPLWKRVRAAHAGVDLVDPLLLQLPGLVNEQHVVFRALVLPQISRVVAVTERDRRSVWEPESLVGGVVLRDPRQLFFQRLDVVVPELRHRAPDDQNLDPCEVQCQQLCLRPHSPAFPSAARTAIGHMPVMIQQKQLLLFVRFPEAALFHPA